MKKRTPLGSLLRRFFFTVTTSLLLITASSLADASITRIGSIEFSIPSPSEPPPANTAFLLKATFKSRGGTFGQPCDISNIQVSIDGTTSDSPPKAGTLHTGHNGVLDQRGFVFRFDSGFAAGTDLTPTITYSASSRSGASCDCTGQSCVEQNPFPPVPPDPKPNLKVEKTVKSSTEVSPGDDVVYRLIVTNTGHGDATNIVLQDVLDSDLLYSKSSGIVPSQAPQVGSSGLVSWPIPSLKANGGKVELSLTVTVSDSAPAGSITNIATATVGTDNAPSQPAVINVNRVPKMRLGKTINSDNLSRVTLPAGSVVTYHLTYSNVGTGDAAGVVISDTLSAELIGTPTLVPAGTWNEQTREVSWAVGDVATNAGPQTVTVSAQIDPTASTLFSNIATVSWSGGSSDSNPATVDLIPEPFFVLEKKVNATVAEPGDTLTFTIKYENKGAAAGINTVVTDTLPVGLTPVAGSYPGANYVAGATPSDPGTLTWALNTVPASATGVLTFDAVVSATTPPGRLLNVAEMTADNVFGSVVATVESAVSILGVIDLSATKVLEPGADPHVTDGDSISYSLRITNQGNVTASNVKLVDPLPRGTSLDEDRSPGWSLVGDNLERPLPDIGPQSSSRSYPLVLIVDGSLLDDGDEIDNVATGTGTAPSGQVGSATTEVVSVTYNARPTIALSKTASPAESLPLFSGDEITYKIEATLQTIMGVTDLQVADLLPPGLQYINAVPTPDQVQSLDSGHTLLAWPVETLLSGSKQFHVKARVSSGVDLGQELFNLAAASYDSNNGKKVALTRHVVSDAAVEITKAVSSGNSPIVPGQELDYTVTYTNTGKAALSGITVTDTLPSNTTVLSTTPTADQPSAGVLSWSLGDLAPGQSQTLLVKLGTTAVAVGDNLINSVTIQTNEAQPQSASVETLVRDAPSLSLHKVPDKSTVYPGETVTFTLSFENGGAGAALNTVLTDKLPAELEFVSASDGRVPDAVTGIITWSLGDIAGNSALATKTVTAKVPLGSYVPAVTATNKATITSETDFDQATAKVVITEQPAFTIAKSVAGGSTSTLNHAAPGDIVHYTLEITKTGGAATDVRIVDILPGQVTYEDNSATFPIDATLSDPDLGLLVWDIGSVPEGNKTLSLSFNVVLDPVITNGSSLENVSFVDSLELGPIASNVVTTIVDSKPVLVVTKQASDGYIFSPPVGSAEVPGTVSFSIEVENQGDSVAEGVVVSDTLPAGLVIDPASTLGSVNGNTVEWSVGDLAPGNVITLQVSAQAAEGLVGNTPLLNKALASTMTAGVGSVPSNEVTVTVVGEAVFTLTKKASAAAVKPGESFVYTLEYENVGTDDSGLLTLEDTLPPDVSFISASGGGATTAPSPPLASPGVLKWVDLPALSPGQIATLQVFVEVNAVVANGTKLPNIATLHETATPAKSVQAQFLGEVPTVSSAPLMTISKTVEGEPTVPAGELVTFNINYGNAGGDAATNPTIRDVLPPGLTLESATGNPTISGNVITWQTTSLPAKQSGDLKVIARAGSDITDGTPLTNSASVTSAETPTPVSSSATVKVLNASLKITKAVDKTTAKSGVSATSTQGDVLTYTIGYENTGSIDATGVTVVDTLPKNVALVGATPAATTAAGSQVSWAIGALKAGEGGTISLQVRVGDDLRNGTQLVNTANITSTNAGPASAPPKTTTVVSSAVLAINKTSAVTEVIPGQEFSYEITLANAGSDTAENVVITDTLPEQVSFVDATANGTLSGDTVTWSIGTMSPNTETRVQVKVLVADVVDEGTVLLNTTSATGSQPGGSLLPPVGDTLQTPVSSKPILVLKYEVNRDTAAPGDRLVYSLRVRNAGDAAAVNAIVEAALPPNTTPVAISGGGSFQQGKAVWTASRLTPSGFIDLQFSADISAVALDGAREPSIAAFGADNAAIRTAKVSTTVVVLKPVLTIEKVGPDSVEAGALIDYRLSYNNSGNALAAGTVIEDTLPSGTTFVSASDGGAETALGSGIVQWNLGTLMDGASGDVALQVQTSALPDNTKLVNQTSLTTTSLSGGVTATAATMVRSHTELDITIVAADDLLKIGDRQEFTVTWANNGNQNTTNAVVKATVPQDTEFYASGAGGTLSGNEVTWLVGDLDAGDTGQATFEVVVASTARDGEQVKSVADISATDGLPDADEAVFVVDDAAPVWPVSAVNVPVSPERLWLLVAILLSLLAGYRLQAGTIYRR